MLPESWQDLINCTLGRKKTRLDVRSQLYKTLPQTKGEYTEYSVKDRDNPELLVNEASLFLDTKLSILFEC